MLTIRDNIARVRECVAAACSRAGRDPESVRLIAVSKTFPAECIRDAYAAGVREFGENRVQEAAGKIAALADLDIAWHLIGHLQSNKAHHAGEIFDWIQSVDSEAVAAKLDRARSGEASRLPVLIQVKLGDEETKHGVSEREALRVAVEIGKLARLKLQGLMLIPPFCENPEDARPYFRRLRELAERIRAAGAPNVSMQHLSMGMSHDYEAAIEEGATMIRVGTAIFGAR